MTDKEKIKAEVSTLIGEALLEHAQYATSPNILYDLKKEYSEKIVALVDSLQEEPVSEELEEAVNAYIGYAPEIDESSSVYGKRLAFKAGAKWQKSQGVTEEAVIGITPKEYFISISQSTVDMLDLCAGDKVIVQLRKKED